MALERDDQHHAIPIIILDQDHRSCLQEILIMYASVLQQPSSSEESTALLETIQQLRTKLNVLATIQGDEALDIDTLENYALHLAFAFYLRAIPLFHLDPAQEQDVLNEVKYLQAYLRVEHIALPEKGS